VLLSGHHHLQQRSFTLNTVNNQPTAEEPVTAMLTGNKQQALQVNTQTSNAKRKDKI